MAYEYEHRIQEIIWSNEDYWCIDNDKESNELREVYAKAKIFDEVIKKVETEFVSEDLADSIRILVNDYEYDMEEK